MKNIITGIVALMIVGTGGVLPQERAGGRDAQFPLEEMAAFAVEEQLEVDSWSVMIKDAFNAEDLPEVREKITSFLPQANVSYEESLQASKIVISNGQKSDDKDEEFILIIPKKDSHQAEMVYKLNSLGIPSLANDNIVDYTNKIKRRFFSDNVPIYSCLYAKSSGIINDVLVYQSFKQKFDITTIEQVKESGWTSRSGYTDKWGDPLPLAGNHMNVQFATRTLGGKTNITIGTPIITAEY